MSGGPGLTARKQPGQRFIVLNFFTVYRGAPMVFITEKTLLLQEYREGPRFSRGQLILGGPNANFYRNA